MRLVAMEIEAAAAPFALDDGPAGAFLRHHHELLAEVVQVAVVGASVYAARGEHGVTIDRLGNRLTEGDALRVRMNRSRHRGGGQKESGQDHRTNEAVRELRPPTGT
ncbi:MAG: hypothetical protein IPK72_17170 [Candidatus Eisenbacteria bacterium]|nr:hypothetical protein [Candidatus Eisenbacteria bacterium]